MKKARPRLLQEVLELPTAPYHEQRVRRYIRAFVADRRYLSYREDRWGNILVSLKFCKGLTPVVFTAHMDHPGFETVEHGTRIRARWLGNIPGPRPRNLPVTVITPDDEEVGGKAVGNFHQRSKRWYFNLEIDAPVPAGSFGYWGFPGYEKKGNLVHTKGADNLGSCAALLALLDDLRPARVRRPVACLFTRAEEEGFQGAQAAVRSGLLSRKSLVVVLETSKEFPGGKMGSGPVIRVADRALSFDPRITFWIERAARKGLAAKRLKKVQRAVMGGGMCEAGLYTLMGYRCGALAIPLGNYHNDGGKKVLPEFIDLRDWQGLVALLRELARTPLTPEGLERKWKKKLAARFERRYMERWS